MAKTYTKEDVKELESVAQAKGEVKGQKAGTKNAIDRLKAEIDRVKASDLGKAEKRAAIAALQNALSAVKSPIG